MEWVLPLIIICSILILVYSFVVVLNNDDA